MNKVGSKRNNQNELFIISRSQIFEKHSLGQDK